MTILFSFFFFLYLLDIQIPLAEVTKLITSVLNSKFITSAIASWPLAAVIIAFAYKKGILQIIEKRKVQLTAGGGNGVQIDIGEVIETKIENIKEATVQPANDTKHVDDTKHANDVKFPELSMTMDNIGLGLTFFKAIQSPVKAFSETWDSFSADLSKTIAVIRENTGLTLEGDPLHVIDVLRQNNKISNETAQAVTQLFEIFRLAQIKGASDQMDKYEFAEKAREYYTVCVVVLSKLRSELSESLAADLRS